MEKLILLTSCVTAVVGDMLFVWWAKEKHHASWFLISAMIFMNISALIWAYSMKAGIDSAVAITVYALFTVAGCSFLGLVIFHETISFVNYIGLLLALVALILVSL